MLFSEDIACRSAQVTIFVRVVKQPELVFCFKDTTAGCIQRFHGYFAFGERFFQGAHETFAYHIHIDASVKGTGRNGLQVTDAMCHHFCNSGKVGHHESVESPLLAQYVSHKPFVGGGGHAVHFVEGGHHAAYTCVDSRLVRI